MGFPLHTCSRKIKIKFHCLRKPYAKDGLQLSGEEEHTQPSRQAYHISVGSPETIPSLLLLQ